MSIRGGQRLSTDAALSRCLQNLGQPAGTEFRHTVLAMLFRVDEDILEPALRIPGLLGVAAEDVHHDVNCKGVFMLTHPLTLIGDVGATVHLFNDPGTIYVKKYRSYLLGKALNEEFHRGGS